MGRGVLLGAQREQPVLRSAFNLVPRAAPPEYHAATREKRAKKKAYMALSPTYIDVIR